MLVDALVDLALVDLALVVLSSCLPPGLVSMLETKAIKNSSIIKCFVKVIVAPRGGFPSLSPSSCSLRKLVELGSSLSG